MEAHWLYGKAKEPGATVRKEGYANIIKYQPLMISLKKIHLLTMHITANYLNKNHLTCIYENKTIELQMNNIGKLFMKIYFKIIIHISLSQW